MRSGHRRRRHRQHAGQLHASVQPGPARLRRSVNGNHYCPRNVPSLKSNNLAVRARRIPVYRQRCRGHMPGRQRL